MVQDFFLPFFRHTSLSVAFMLYHSHHFLFYVFSPSHKKSVISHSRACLSKKEEKCAIPLVPEKTIMIHHTIFHTCKNAFPRKNGEKLWFWHFLSILAFFVKRHLVALYFTLKQDTTADSVLSSAESDKERLFWPPMEQSKVRNWNFLGFGHPILWPPF